MLMASFTQQRREKRIRASLASAWGKKSYYDFLKISTMGKKRLTDAFAALFIFKNRFWKNKLNFVEKFG
jgi:hypothetical protein